VSAAEHARGSGLRFDWRYFVRHLRSKPALLEFELWTYTSSHSRVCQ
jgi:hypothetical protein